MSYESSIQEVEIFGRQFRIQCSVAHIKELQHCATYVDGKLRQIIEQSNNKMISLERIAIMAALQIAQELLAEQRQQAGNIETMGHNIRELQNKVEKFLVKEEELAV